MPKGLADRVADVAPAPDGVDLSVHGGEVQAHRHDADVAPARFAPRRKHASTMRAFDKPVLLISKRCFVTNTFRLCAAARSRVLSIVSATSGVVAAASAPSFRRRLPP